MCRSITVLRPPYVDEVTEQDVREAALQYVRKVAGMRSPSARNAEVFDAAVDAVARATAELLSGLVVRSPAPSLSGQAGGPARTDRVTLS